MELMVGNISYSSIYTKTDNIITISTPNNITALFNGVINYYLNETIPIWLYTSSVLSNGVYGQCYGYDVIGYGVYLIGGRTQFTTYFTNRTSIFNASDQQFSF